MNPAESGWLRKYIAYRERLFREGGLDSFFKLMDESEDSFAFLYRLIQPTGLMYGHPIHFIDAPHPLAHEWDEKEKIKVLLAEGYLISGLYYQRGAAFEFRPAVQQILSDIKGFYEANYHLYGASPKTLFGGRRQVVDQIEYILDRRIHIRYDWRNFWTSFFHNSLLFFDLVLFFQWKENPVLLDPETLKAQREALRMHILRVIAAAAHADGEVQIEEREIFSYFLHSANLPFNKKRQAATFIQQGVSLDDIQLEAIGSWVLKKYFLELAILTTWANRRISEDERAFLRKLAHHLDLGTDDLLASMNAVRDFVMQYWDQVHYLQVRQNYRIVSERLIRRMQQIVRKNQRLISLEIKESRELVVLLAKSRKEELTAHEKEKVRTQLLDILKTIPTFAFLLLPGAFITLPILFRIIPKQVLFPSSFLQNQPAPDEL
ncbi:MAG: hypothetical protein OHK0039_25850 [Bacteroidia bacterium]